MLCSAQRCQRQSIQASKSHTWAYLLLGNTQLFFPLGKATEGPAGATRGGLGTRHRGAAPQRAGARARTRAGALPSWESHQPSYARSARDHSLIQIALANKEFNHL